MTERQLEMVQVAARYVDAWIDKDGDAVASFMVPSGSVNFPTFGNRTVRADDGTLQDWVANMDWMISIEFTTSGAVMIVSDTHWAW